MRQYGEIEGPYVLQMDACKCLANGVDRFNDFMGREAIRVIFRGRDEEDPKARCAGRPRRGGRGHLGNLGSVWSLQQGRGCSCSLLVLDEMKFPGLQELSSFVQFQRLEIGVVRVSALGNRARTPENSERTTAPGRRPFAVFPGGPKTRLLRFSLRFRTCIGNTLGIL